MNIQKAIPIALFTAALGAIPVARVQAYEINEKTNSVKVTSLADFSKCNDEFYPEACLEALKVYVKAHPSEAFKAGKLVRLNFTHWAALPFFSQGMGSKPTPEHCKDEDVRMAVTSGLALRSDDPNAQLAIKLASGTCWEQLQGSLVTELADGGAYFRDNTCPFLKAKGINKPECQPKVDTSAADAKAASAATLAKLKTDWTKLKLDPSSAKAFIGPNEEQLLMIKAGPSQDNLHLIKFKRIEGPWQGKTLLTVAAPGGGSGTNFVAAINGREWVAMTERDGMFQAYPEGYKDSVNLFRASLPDRRERPSSTAIMAEFSPSPATKQK
jgi:hypothetical protein